MRSTLGAPVLELRAVSCWLRAGVSGCSARVRVLDTVDLVLRRGERVAVVGPPGSGKTVLLLLAAGLLTPDRGTSWAFAGASLRLPRPLRAARMTVAEAVAPFASGGEESLRWSGSPGAALVVARNHALIGGRVDRVLRLERARLCAVRRVDSPLGPA